MKYFILFFISVTFLNANWKAERENLSFVYRIGEFRIFYNTEGKNKLPISNQEDLNNNSIPDYIEHIGLKLYISSIIFQNEFKLKSPLKTLRYKDKVSYIDIHMLNMNSKGSGGDGIHFFKYKILPNNIDKSLAIKLSTNLRDKTLTPTHELFHLYQNGYTMFKNRWFTEGTARWSEYVLKKGTGSRKKLPSNVKELKVILSQTYDTKYMWRRLAYLLDKNNGHFNYSNKVNNIIGYPIVLEDNRIYGVNFIKRLLENLSIMDKRASLYYAIPTYNWDEKLQKSDKNNKYILKALSKTIKEELIFKNTELEKFIDVIDRFLREKN